MISVIVPIYNAENYLRQCLNSLAKQTYRDLEVVMVNDGSTDSSRDICMEFCDKYKNFVLVDKENGGQMSAWILGVHKAKGDYFGFVDSDDYVAVDMYEKMMKCEERTHADVVMCDFFDLNKDSATQRGEKYMSYYGPEEIDKIHATVFPTITTYISVSRWDKLFKRELYLKCTDKYCTYHARTMEDRFIVSSYLFGCNSFAYIDEPLYFWRKRKSSSSRKSRPELIEIVNNLYASQKQMLIDYGKYDKYKDKLEVGKINLLRLVIERNLKSSWSFSEKLKYSRLILSDENRQIVKSHRKDCVGKFGVFFYLVCLLNSRMMLVLGNQFTSFSKTLPIENAYD